MTALLILLFLVVAVGGYLIGVYNGLVRVRAAVKLAWSNIDVLLVQRHDELPKLVEVCKQYMQYESGTLERVMRARAGVEAARSSGSMSSLGSAERELLCGLGGLYAVSAQLPGRKPASRSAACSSASAAWKLASPTGARSTTRRSTPTTCASTRFPDLLVARLGELPAGAAAAVPRLTTRRTSISRPRSPA